MEKGRQSEPHSGRSGTNLPQLADLNEAVVLGWIRRTPGGLSRVELTRATDLSPQAVSNICQRLLDEGVIMEAGKASSGFGKPRTLLTLDPTGCYAVGVHLDPTVVTMVLLDFLGVVCAHTSFLTAAADAPDELLAKIGERVNGLIDGAGIDRDRVLGVGIASPGPIDQDTGSVLDPPLLTEWHHVAVRDQLGAATGLPTLLDKDVIAAAIAERWAGEAAQSRNFAFIYLGAGIGAGVVVEDVVVRGVSGNAGDIGMFEVSASDGPGTRDLGEMTNPDSLLRQAVRAGVFPNAPGPEDPLAVDEGFTELCRRADAGDGRASAILDQAAARIGGAVSRIANLLDVDTIIFGGTTWSRVADRYLGTMTHIIQATSITRDIHPIRVVGTALGEDVGAIGAACLVLDNKTSAHPRRMLQSF
ncbi:MAG: xylose repressor [Microbacteriaceae bacterium]|nr:xylose repressor [Microbacteriaceae bacterium]